MTGILTCWFTVELPADMTEEQVTAWINDRKETILNGSNLNPYENETTIDEAVSVSDFSPVSFDGPAFPPCDRPDAIELLDFVIREEN